ASAARSSRPRVVRLFWSAVCSTALDGRQQPKAVLHTALQKTPTDCARLLGSRGEVGSAAAGRYTDDRPRPGRRHRALPGDRALMNLPGCDPAARRRIYLVRHADVSYFDGDGRPVRPDTVPLNPEGRRQAEALARELAAVPFDRAVSSDLPRC